MPKQISYLKVGECKGTPRIWIQTNRLADAGFGIGQTYSVDISPDDFRITLRAEDGGPRVVSRKKAGGSDVPIIDLNNKKIGDLIPGTVDRVRVSVEDGVIEITIHPDDLRVQQRLETLKTKLESNQPLTTGEICAGGGILADAMHAGLASANIKTETAFVIEQENRYLEQLQKNKRIVSDKTTIIEGGMQEVDLGDIPKVDLLWSGIPCSGMSQAGRSKKGISCGEMHDKVGHLFVSFLSIVKATQSIVAAPKKCNKLFNMLFFKCLSNIISFYKWVDLKFSSRVDLEFTHA